MVVASDQVGRHVGEPCGRRQRRGQFGAYCVQVVATPGLVEVVRPIVVNHDARAQRCQRAGHREPDAAAARNPRPTPSGLLRVVAGQLHVPIVGSGAVNHRAAQPVELRPPRPRQTRGEWTHVTSGHRSCMHAGSYVSEGQLR